tara:strand:- start:7279 stop:8061 length:783 start_codon:yes stop_codon:yes gene_type:complete
MKKVPQNLRDFTALKSIVHALRDPVGGCPWDLQQSHESLCPYAIEEAYELVDAIQNNTPEEVKEELGDVLLQVMIHAEIAAQNKDFNIEDVIETISKKMVRRHPHVFGDTKVKDSGEVMKNWEQIKKQEKPNKSAFDLPAQLPALLAADKIGKKSKKFGFDWDHHQEVWPKLEEEMAELQEAIEENNKVHMEEELGDLLFVVAQIARHLDIEPEMALRKANAKFLSRFDKMMTYCQEHSLDWQSLSLEKKEEVWQSIKKL